MKKTSPNSTPLKLSLDMIIRPARALDTLLSDNRPLRPAAIIYFVYLMAAIFFYTYKPADFPPTNVPVMNFEGDLFFWFKVHAWNPLFTLIGIAFIGWFAQRMRGGHLAVRLFISGVFGLIPFALLLAHANGVLGKASFVAAWILLIAASIPGFRAAERTIWQPLAALFMSVNAVAIAALPFLTAAVALHAGPFYSLVEVIMMFWMLGLAAYGVSRITGIQTARAFCAIFLSTICQVFFIFSLHMLGLIPRDALKALMTV